ncbi:MAG: sortase [Anaerolineaceae bacterium]|nr:sortase [Anaerolineaceae bacterium]
MPKTGPQKILSLILIYFLVVTAFLTTPVEVRAANHAVANGESLDLTTGILTKADASTVNYSLVNGDTITVADDAVAAINGSADVYIQCGSNITLTINDVSIMNGYSSSPAAPLAFSGTGNTLILVGVNTLTSYATWNDSVVLPGLEVPTGAALTIQGTGSLKADAGGTSSYGGAGIGGGKNQNAGTIVIESGTIEALGGYYSAGIGAGMGAVGNSGTITINGGDVTATGGTRASGIGGSGGDGTSVNASHGGNITINGGKVTATGKSYGAGIGGGWYGNGGSITITGGEKITATGGGFYAAGIGGGGNGGDGGTILITGGTIIANGTEGAAGIGGGYQGDGGSITISGGNITASTSNNGAGIGGGMYNPGGGYNGGDGGTINISGGTINASGGGVGAGIGGGGGGFTATGGIINISGGTITATGVNGSGIGKGQSNNNGSVDISGTAKIFANGNNGDISGTISIAGSSVVCLGGSSVLGNLTTITHGQNLSPAIDSTADTIEGYAVPHEWTSTTSSGYFLTVTYQVIFEENGGSNVSDLTGVDENSTITAPNPASTKSGFDYAEWYQDSALQNPWIFNTNTVTANITLYAKWNILDPSSIFVIDGDTNGEIVGTFSGSDGATYALVNGGSYPDNAFFTISEYKLHFASTANISTKNSYVISLQVTTASGETYEKELTINVKNNGQANGGLAIIDRKNIELNSSIEYDPEGNDILSKFGQQWGMHHIVNGPQHGTAEIGSIIYTPDTDYSGSDSLTYLICDNADYCMRGSAEFTIENGISSNKSSAEFNPDELPASGFTPDTQTNLSVQDIVYSRNGLHLRVPVLGVDTGIVGVPFENNRWEVTWLGDQAGWLEGTAYPTWAGNTVITGHLVNSMGNESIFGDLESLKYDDLIYIDYGGITYTYAVRENKMVLPKNLKILKHEELDWLTLITCKGYMEDIEEYAFRTVVRAVLVRVD